ncbi:hypothetical protein DEO72_LG4g294 [Vigna unguiculata]|uniref:Uncharacterized protein n=1 Tax=Vigna unguiculata TaxID=3917 RepID=A0A4D6LLF0_VIGUN|nr:hypothetical protein DEO72_LG4g294 [Vigna unguiculata]
MNLAIKVWLNEKEGLKLKLRLERCHIIKRKTEKYRMLEGGVPSVIGERRSSEGNKTS